jgi:hypothetical protein
MITEAGNAEPQVDYAPKRLDMEPAASEPRN